MSSYIIATDFDGTICENKYPEIGEPRRNTILYLKEKQKKGDPFNVGTLVREQGGPMVLHSIPAPLLGSCHEV